MLLDTAKPKLSVIKHEHPFRESCVCEVCAEARKYRNLSAHITQLLKPLNLHLWALTNLWPQPKPPKK